MKKYPGKIQNQKLKERLEKASKCKKKKILVLRWKLKTLDGQNLERNFPKLSIVQILHSTILGERLNYLYIPFTVK